MLVFLYVIRYINMDFKLDFKAFDHTRRTISRMNGRLKVLARSANSVNTALGAGSLRSAQSITRMSHASVRASRAMNSGLAETQRRLSSIASRSARIGGVGGGVGAGAGAGAVSRTRAGGNAIGALGIAFGAFKGLATPIMQAKEYETAWINVTKSVDGTVEQMARLRKGLRQMDGMGFDGLTEISAAVGKMGISIDDNLAFTKTIMMGSVALDMSAAESAKAMGKYLALTNQLDNAATSAAQAMDMIANAENKLANVDATSLLDVLERNSSLSLQLGFDNQQSVALAAYINQTSTSAELGASEFKMAMKAFKKTDAKLGLFTRLKTGGFSELSNIAHQLSGQTGAQLLDAFGGEAATFLEKLIMPKNIAKLDNAFNVAGSSKGAAVAEFEKYMASLDQKLKVAEKRLRNFSASIGNVLMPTVKALTEKFIGFFMVISTWMDENKELSSTIISIAGAFAAFALVAAVVGLVVMGLGIAFSTVAAGLSVVAVLASPVVLAIAAISAAIYLVYTNWGSFMSWIEDKITAFTESESYKNFMSFIHAMGNFNPVSSISSGIDGFLSSANDFIFGDSGGSGINNTNPVGGEIKVVVESKDGTPVAGTVQSQKNVNLNLGMVY